MCLKSLLKPFTFVDCLTSKGKSFQNFGLAMEKMPDHHTIVLAYPTSRSLCTAADLSHLEYKEAITRFTITWILIFFLYHCHKSNTDNCYFLQLASVMCIISIIMIIVMIMIIIIINIIIISHYYNYYYSWTGPEVSPEEEGRKWG